MRASILIAGLAIAAIAGYGAAHSWYKSAWHELAVAPAAAQSAETPVPNATPPSAPVITLPNGQKLDSETLGPVIEQYLLDHPEVIVKAVEKLQQKQAAADQANFQDTAAGVRQQLLNAPLSPVLGNPKGDVTVVEFFDYKCPYCKRVADDVSKLISDDPNVRVVFKEFPILGPDSQIAALAGLAANRQGKYAAFHMAAMEHRGTFTKDNVLAIAKESGLDIDKLQADMKDQALINEIAANQALADKLGINGTPAFIIGKEKVPGAISLDDMKKLVGEARNQKG